MASLAASITLMPGDRSSCCISAVQHVGGVLTCFFWLASHRVAAPVASLLIPLPCKHAATLSSGPAPA